MSSFMGEFADPLETRPKRASRAIGLFIRMEKHWLMYSTWRIIVKSSWRNAASFRFDVERINKSFSCGKSLIFLILFFYIYIYIVKIYANKEEYLFFF